MIKFSSYSKCANIPRLLLFDVDGTLTWSKHFYLGKGPGSSLLEALSIVFKRPFERNNVEFAGTMTLLQVDLLIFHFSNTSF